MNKPLPQESDQKKTKKWAQISTIFYLILFPIFFAIALASFMIFDRPNMSLPFGFTIIAIFFFIALSMPYYLYFVWSRYNQGNYKKSRHYCWMPLRIIGIGLFIVIILDIYQNFFT